MRGRTLLAMSSPSASYMSVHEAMFAGGGVSIRLTWRRSCAASAAIPEAPGLAGRGLAARDYYLDELPGRKSSTA